MRGSLKICVFAIVLSCLFSCGKTKDVEKKVDGLLKARDYANALSILDESIKEDPSNKRYRFLKLKVYARSGNTDMAYEELGRLYSMTGKVDKEVLKELITASAGSFISTYKFTSLINLAEMKNLDEEAIKSILDALEDKDDTVKVGAIWAAGRHKIIKSEKRLMELLNHKNPGVVFNALWALGELRTEGGKGVILNFVNNPKDENFLPEAIIALGKLGDKSALTYLKRYINSTNKKVSVAALATTSYLEKGSLKDVFDFYQSRKDEEALSFLYLVAGELKIKETAPYLLNALKEKSSESKERVIRAAAEIGIDDRGLVEQLKRFLKSKDNGERTQAYYALFKLGVKDKDAFKEGVSDKLPEVRRFSYLGLGIINDKESEEILITRLISANIFDRISVTYALALK